MVELTHERLIALISYDPDTGIFRNRVSRRGKVVAGGLAGCWRDGELTIKIDCVGYRANRLAYFYMTGGWPVHYVDHQDRDTKNNRWPNLRPATSGENAQNRGLAGNNTSGHTGVSWCKRTGKWQALITVGGRQRHLGRYETIEDAVATRSAAKANLHTFQPVI